MQTGRWTILARATPLRRRPSVPAIRARVHVRCVCGVERIIWLEDLESGRSRGCESRRCAARFLASADIREMLDGWVERDRAAVVALGVEQLVDAHALSTLADVFVRERRLLIDEAIRDYLRPGTPKHDLEPQSASRVFCLRA